MKRPIIALISTALVLTACNRGPTSKSQVEGQTETEKAFAQQRSAVPYPVSALTDSTERRNLREKLLRFNKPDRLGYVYIMQFGKPIGYYAIEGKVSSNSSQMTPTDIVVKPCSGCDRFVIPGPQDDGSYSSSEPGIFFFTTEGALIQTDSDYIYSDQPIPTFVSLPKFNGTTKVTDLTKRK